MIQEQKTYDSNVMQQILYRSNFPISHQYFLIALNTETKHIAVFIAQAYVLSTTEALNNKKLYKTFMNMFPRGIRLK